MNGRTEHLSTRKRESTTTKPRNFSEGLARMTRDAEQRRLEEQRKHELKREEESRAAERRRLKYGYD